MAMSCGLRDYDDHAWWYTPADDFSALDTKRARRCCSCGEKLKVGVQVLKFRRWRNPRNDFEDRFYGDGGEVPMPTMYMCEECGSIALACELSEVSFLLGEDNLKEEVEVFVKKKSKFL